MAITMAVRPLNHLLELAILHRLSQLLGHPPQTLKSDVAAVLLVEELEDLADILLGVPITHPRGHQVQEFPELDGARVVGVEVVDHLVNGLVAGLQAQSVHGIFQFLGVDGTTLVSIEEIEGFLDLDEFFS